MFLFNIILSIGTDSMRSDKFRSNIEGKFTVDVASGVLLPMLNSLCQRDSEHPSDYINSIYYDTANMKLLDQKVDSEYHKNKVRLRWYGMPDESTDTVSAYLEIKQKKGVQRFKVRKQFEVPTSFLMPGREVMGELTGFADHVSDLGFSPIGALFPMIVIRYHRHRFTEPESGARISLDSRIKYTRVNGIFFPETGPRTLRHSVLEVKSDTGEIPRGMMAIKNRINTRDSFSKYEECWNMYASTFYRRELTSSRYN